MENVKQRIVLMPALRCVATTREPGKEFVHMTITNPAGWDAQNRTKIFLMAVGFSAQITAAL